MKKEKLLTYAKLNLSLIVYKPKPNNYHPLRSIFQTINLYDILTITPLPEKKLIITSNHPSVPLNEENILYKVYNSVKTQLSNGFAIDIEKNIPMGGGMGGGSTNAAGFITYLKKNYPDSTSHLTPNKISLKIGADVPFFLEGKTALVSGIGEKITSIKTKISHDFLLILPKIHCDTKMIYTQYDQKKDAKKPGPTPKWMLDNHIGHNDLKSIVFKQHPILEKLEHNLSEFQIPIYMSGSGSTLFIPLLNMQWEKIITKLLQEKFPTFESKIVSPITNPAVIFLQ